MAHDPQTVSIQAGAWGNDAERLISQAHQSASPEEIRAQIEGGGAELFYVKTGATIAGAFVLRVDHTAAGSEGVIVSAAGHIDGVDLIEVCLPAIEKMFYGVRAIRFHTARPALARRLAGWGYQASEIVCRREVKNAKHQ